VGGGPDKTNGGASVIAMLGSTLGTRRDASVGGGIGRPNQFFTADNAIAHTSGGERDRE
jgi:hypothetical protein